MTLNSSFKKEEESKADVKISADTNISPLQKSEILQLIKNTTVNENIFSKEDEEFGGYVYKKAKTKFKGQYVFEKTWLCVINNHILYTRNNVRKIHHLCIAEVLNHTPKEEFIKEGRVTSFSIKINGKIKTFYCKNDNDSQSWIDFLKKCIGYRDINFHYKLGEVIIYYEGIEYLKAFDVKSKQVALAKVIKKDQTTMTEEYIASLKNEMDIIKICNHGNIIKCYDSFEDINNYYIIYEYVIGGEINTFLRINENKIQDEKKLHFIFEIAKGLSHLHELGIVHRNLVPDNIWMNVSNYLYSLPKITDFKYAIVLGKTEKTFGRYGNLGLAAPEVISDNKYNRSVDIWSYGSVLYYILSGYVPFFEIKEAHKRGSAILYKDITFPKQAWPSKYDGIKELIAKCLKKESELRLCIQDIVNYSLFERLKY